MRTLTSKGAGVVSEVLWKVKYPVDTMAILEELVRIARGIM